MTEREVFEHALQIANAEERAAYVQKASGGDQVLAQRVAELLAGHAAAGSFLESPAGLNTGASGTEAHSPESRTAASVGVAVGDVVAGKYKLLQMIGEGGMGVVYMAEQRQPVVRRVALKIIKPGLQSAEILARFEAERQALAVMDHPHIARVFDAGTTDAGLPYFVMELVHGLPITRYCDEAQLNVSERLALFVPVCQAVQHAHQKGIIHRDIKPSNVLIAQYDGKPVPKVIDFGVAKAIGHTLTDKTLFTQFGSVVGTLEYMSPEQATLNALDVDTRSDIYSLGVLLYELLTGDTPMDRQLLRRAAFDEVIRVIRCEEPPKPSTRLSSSARLPAIAAERRVEPRRLASLVRGDLDWIVMKALEKERDRRYDTAKDLAEDVERHLVSQPVAAGPPSSWYRLRKYARRNRGRLLAAASVAAVLVAAAGVIFWLSDRTRRLNVQVATEQHLASEAKHKAEETRNQAKQQQVFVANMGQGFDPNADSESKLSSTLNMMKMALPGEAGQVTGQAMKLGIEGGKLLEEGKATEALAIFDEALAMLRGLPKFENDPYKAKEQVIDMALIMAHSGRGGALDLLHRDDEADQAWNEAIAVCPAFMRADVQSERLSYLLKTGSLTKAVATADQWTSEPNPSANLLVGAAKVYARAAAESASADEAESRRTQAIALLEQAERQGYFGVAWKRKNLADAAAWKPLRGSGEFEQLVSRVAAAPPAKPPEIGKLLSAFNLIFAAGNAGDSAESVELLDQAGAQLESALPEGDERMRLYLGAYRKATAGIKLSQQGRNEEAASMFDTADEMVTKLSKLPPSSEMPAGALDALRKMIDASRKAEKAPRSKGEL